MYGLDGLNDEEIQQLLGSLPDNFQAQSLPQIQQGLLGSAGEQNQGAQDVINNGQQAAANMAQAAMQSADNNIAAKQAADQQIALQHQQQVQNRQAQAGGLLGKIASLFIPGGSLLGLLKK